MYFFSLSQDVKGFCMERYFFHMYKERQVFMLYNKSTAGANPASYLWVCSGAWGEEALYSRIE